LKKFTVIEMILVKPIVCDFHSSLYVDFELLGFVLFDTPGEIVFGDAKGKGRGRLR